MLSFLSSVLLFSAVITLPSALAVGLSGTDARSLQSRQAANNILGCAPIAALFPGATTTTTRRRQAANCAGTCTTGGYQYSAEANRGATCICSNTLDATQLVAANSDGTCRSGTVEVIDNNVLASVTASIAASPSASASSSSISAGTASATTPPSAFLTATDDIFFTLESLLSSLSTEILGTSAMPTAAPTDAVEGVFYTLDSLVSSLSTEIVNAAPTASASPSVTSGVGSGNTNPLLSFINGILGNILGNGGGSTGFGGGSADPLESLLSSASTQFFGNGAVPTSVAGGTNPLASLLSSISTHVLGTSTLSTVSVPTVTAIIGDGGLIPISLPFSLDLGGIPLIGNGGAGASTSSPSATPSSIATSSRSATSSSSAKSSSPSTTSAPTSTSSTAAASSSSASTPYGIPLFGSGGLIPITLPLGLGGLPLIGGLGPAAAPTSTSSSSTGASATSASASATGASGSATVTSGSSTSASTTSGSPTSTQTAALPTYTPLGCYAEPPEHDGVTLALTNYTTGPQSDMTVELCVSTCASLGYPLAGVEFGDDCFCGDGTYNGGHPDPIGNCTTPCSGNPSEVCGGNYVFDLYADLTFLNSFYAKFPAAKYSSSKRSWPRFARGHYPA